MRNLLATVNALMPEWQADRIGSIAYLPGGYANDNYRLEYDGVHYALRIARDAGGSREAEARFLRLPSAPDAVAFDVRRGHLLTRWIEGRLLAERSVPPPTAAAYLGALHREIPRGIRRYDPWRAIRRDLRDAPAVAPAARTALDRLDWAPAALRGCHNDLNPWNILRTGTSWRTLDWEFAGDNDPLFDLVCLGRGLRYDDAALAALAAAYPGSPAPSARRLLDTRILFELREYAWAVGQQARGNERDEIRAQAVDAERTLDGLLQRREGAS